VEGFWGRELSSSEGNNSASEESGIRADEVSRQMSLEDVPVIAG